MNENIKELAKINTRKIKVSQPIKIKQKLN